MKGPAGVANRHPCRSPCAGDQVLPGPKSDPKLRGIPAVVLTTSEAEEGILASDNLPANCQVTKPVGLDQIISVVRQIDRFWLEVVKLPTEEP